MELMKMPESPFKEQPVDGSMRVSRLEAMRKLAELRDDLAARDALGAQDYSPANTEASVPTGITPADDDAGFMRRNNNAERRELLRKINILEQAIKGGRR